ncbi:MAG: aminoglycoside phosphotransferase family protein [Chlamydiota bacterium]
MSKKFPTQSIAECLDSHYGISATNVTPLNMGADINASTYKVETQDGPTYFVKLKQGHLSDISVKLLAFLNKSGIQQVIPSVKTVDGKLTLRINDCTLSVYPFVNGQNGFSCGLSGDQWILLGKTLRQVHELDLTPWIKNHIGKETYSTKRREAASALLDKQMDCGLVSDEVALRLQAFIKENRSLMHHLVNRAEYLSLLVREQSPKFVLCHSDIHGGNVLIDESGSIFIVDWDEPIIAPKERDLMFIGGGVANVWNDPREEELFYDGYGKTSIDKVALAYYRYERIVVDIAEYIHPLLFTSDGGDDRQKMYKQFLDMFEPNGVVDIALKTDDELNHG